MTNAARELDIVLFGATGFTGRLVAAYLAKSAGAAVRWAIAGRSRGKLEEVKAELVAIDSRLRELPVLVADAHDEASLDAVIPRSRVVCTTVGPFAAHGRALVDGCAQHGTHYCDITGEVPFIRASIDANHAKAIESRARIVHCCGFDSIPFDLGVHMLWDHAKRSGLELALVKGFAGEMKGAFSGGTIASMLALMEEAARDRKVRRLIADPHALDPTPSLDARARRSGARDERDQHGVRFDEDLGRWTGPFVMSGVNTRVVRRSNALLDGAYGPNFEYRESMSFPKGPKGLVAAAALTSGLGAFVAATAFGPTRELLKKVLPKPGDGPSREARDAGYFTIRFFARTEAPLRAGARPGAPRAGASRLTGRVEGTSDPGYGETAKMLGESALCLAEDAARLDPRFGVLTPATAMGMRLVDRLRAKGMTFAVE
jgi:short subunit dehydrogenase-like uncharacterized protein